MRRPTPRGVAVSLLAGVAGLAGSFLVAGASEGFVVAGLSSLVTALTPGAIVTVSITELGDLAATLVVLTSLVLAVGLYAVVAGVATALWPRPRDRYRAFAGAVAGGWLLTVLLTGDSFASLGAAVPLGLVVLLGSLGLAPGEASFDPGRRHVGRLVAAVAGFSALSYVAAPGEEAEPEPLEFSEAERATIESKLSTARERSLDVDTPSGLVSEVGDFYEVDINPAVNPDVSQDGWHLGVTGAVGRQRGIGYDELLAEDPVHRFHTLRCVGEPLNAHKMDTALWTGIPMDRLIDEAEPSSDCGCVVVRAVDGYFEEFPIDALRRGVLVYGMNGERLPRAHGAPVRLVVPGHWGEISVKWVSEVEFLEEEMDGYWEQRGWHGTGPVKTVAKLHAVEHREGETVRIGGHAYAGYRGIGGVEVTTDGGETWQEATLSEPLPDDATWRQWAHEVEVGEPTEVAVRAIERDGTIQPRDETGPFPSGPSGWVTRTIEPG